MFLFRNFTWHITERGEKNGSTHAHVTHYLARAKGDAEAISHA
jgi:hypothetical protein